MANKRANEPRVFMRAPVSFRDRVMKIAHAAGMDATVYLEKCEVIRHDNKEE